MAFCTPIYVIGGYLWWLVMILNSTEWSYTAGVPHGDVWSCLLFNLYIRHLNQQLLSFILQFI